MPLDILKQFNWVDILVVIVLFRIVYISISCGLSIELFKLLGTISAIYLSLHYYTAFTDWLTTSMNLNRDKAPLELLDFFSFVILAALGYLMLVLLRIAFYRLMKLDAVPQLNKYGGLILGIARGILLSGLIVFMMAISTLNYLKESAGASYSGKYLFNIAPATYSSLWNGFFSKFMGHEKYNQTISEVQRDFKQ